MVHILFLDHATALGGAERSLLLLLETIERRRFAPLLAAPLGELERAARGLGITVHEVGFGRLRDRTWGAGHLLRGVYRLARYARRQRVRLIHANTMRSAVYGALTARLAGIPLVWHVRDVLSASWSVRGLCASSRAVIAVSHAAAQALPSHPHVHVIHNGVRAREFPDTRAGRPAESLALRARWRVPETAILVGHVARLRPWKGQRDVVAAAERVLTRRPDVYFALIGGDIFGDAASYEAALRKEIQDRGLEARVILTGHEQHPPGVFGALDIAVNASDGEPFGRAIIEAAAAALPIVAYAGGGTIEILAHEDNGLLVPPGDREALADEILRLVETPTLAERIGTRARATVIERFPAEAATRRVEAVLDGVLERSQ